MLVTTPLKKKAKPNVRRPADPKREAPGRNGNGINGNGSHRNGNGSASNGRPVYGKRVKNGREKSGRLSLLKLKPWKVILGAIAIGALGVLYLNHVFATQELLREVQVLEREFNDARRTNGDYRLVYDRMIGPANIYEQAKSLGFINGGPAEKVLEVEEE